MLAVWWAFWLGACFGILLRFLEPTAGIMAFVVVVLVFILAALLSILDRLGRK